MASNKTKMVSLRLREETNRQLLELTELHGYASVADTLRFLIIQSHKKAVEAGDLQCKDNK